MSYIMEFVDKIVGVTPQPFDLTGSRFDQSTFYGRWRNFMDMISPSSLFYSLDQANELKDMLDQYKAGKVTNKTDAELWEAHNIVKSTFHPDTGEPIMKAFRLSSFGPANIPIMIGMLLSKKTAFSIPFWQATNQTYNVGFNYCNRSINTPFTTTQLVTSYLIATSLSVVISTYIDKVITRRWGSSIMMRTLGPATAVSIAGFANLMVIRYRELYEGIKVFDKDGNFLGMSKMAAVDGLTKTGGIRLGMQYPLCFWPVIMAGGMKKIGLYPSRGPGKIGAEVFVLCTTLYFMLTACFALYPQKIEADQLEPFLHSPNKFYYNRGL